MISVYCSRERSASFEPRGSGITAAMLFVLVACALWLLSTFQQSLGTPGNPVLWLFCRMGILPRICCRISILRREIQIKAVEVRINLQKYNFVSPGSLNNLHVIADLVIPSYHSTPQTPASDHSIVLQIIQGVTKVVVQRFRIIARSVII